MNFHVLDHQGKSRMLVDTLLAAGHTHTAAGHADLLLIDIDDPDAPRRGRLIDQCQGTVVLYPHGATPTYHGFYEPDDRIDVQLVHGVGTAKLVADLDLDRKIIDAGWTFSPMLPFAPTEGKRVVFGPTHPYGSGKLDDQYRNLNGRVYRALKASGLDLKVQMFGLAANNGLPHGASCHRSSLMLDWSLIDKADVVVADGTFASLAMARGKPVVMFGQDLEVTDEHNRPQTGPIVRLPRYPVDFDDGDLAGLIDKACRGVGEDWRKQFVGVPFDSMAFLHSVENAVAVAA